MPTWLSVDFVVANWQPLLVTLILGYIVGWLITGIPNKRHANEAEDRASSLDARLRKSERELTDVRREGESAKSRLAIAQTDLDTAQARIHELETPPVEESVAEVEDRLAEVAIVAASDDTAVAEETLGDDSAAALATVAAIAVATPDEDETMTMLIPALAGEPAVVEEPAVVDVPEDMDVDQETVDAFGAVARTPDLSTLPNAKDIALNEAYARATALQAELASADVTLKARAAELDAARSDLAVANAARNELETRLVRAREDVASELAILASTMIKMKDDALARADARIATLTAEADTLRAAQKALPKPTIPTPTIPVPAKPTPSLTVAVTPSAATPSAATTGAEAMNVDAPAADASPIVVAVDDAIHGVPADVSEEDNVLAAAASEANETIYSESTSNGSESGDVTPENAATDGSPDTDEVASSEMTDNAQHRTES